MTEAMILAALVWLGRGVLVPWAITFGMTWLMMMVGWYVFSAKLDN